MIRSGRPHFSVPHGALSLLGKFEPGLIVDVGAAAGHITKRALMASPDSHAMCFEPFPGNWPFIEKTLSGTRSQIIRAAVSDKQGEVDFYVSSTVKDGSGWVGYGGYSSVGYIVQDKAGSKNTIKVPMTTLDTHVHERVLLLKIDVQGGEIGVLRGARKVFEQGIDICYIEFSGETQILHFLLERGYIIFDHQYIATGKSDPDFSNWNVVEPIKLSTGAVAYHLWPKQTPSAPEDFARMFDIESQRIGPVQTDIIAVRPEIARLAGWA